MKIKITTTALLLAASMGANAATIHTGLVNYWTLDGNGDDTAGDFAEGASTVADTAAITGTAGAATLSSTGGLFGGSAAFERTVALDGALSVTSSADTIFTGASVTVSLWAQFDDNVGSWQGLASTGEGDNYRIARRSDQNRLAAAFGTGDAQGVTGQADINSGDWFHVLATSSNDGAGNFTTSLFVNGVLESTNTGTGGIQDSGNAFLIGNNPDEPDRQWDGLIDDVAVFNIALDADDAAEIYNAGLAGISLGQIPEPSSTALLGLGGLAFVLRRRR